MNSQPVNLAALHSVQVFYNKANVRGVCCPAWWEAAAQKREVVRRGQGGCYNLLRCCPPQVIGEGEKLLVERAFLRVCGVWCRVHQGLSVRSPQAPRS